MSSTGVALVSGRIHHLNCGTLCPFCERLLNDPAGRWTRPGELVCHCLLIEAGEVLVLVDTGIGLQDIASPRARLGRLPSTLFRFQLRRAETAFEQVRALGFQPEDVRHIVTTHLDLDHAGGLADFPHAEVHLLQAELDHIQRPSLRDRLRFRPPQFDHGPRWVVHPENGEDWFGFAGIRAIPGLPVDILMIPLPGHTRGHVGVAVRAGDRWLLHCGDAYYHRSQVSADPRVPAALMLLQRSIASIPKARAQNLQRLQELALQRPGEVELFCAHDPVELRRYAS